jgi:Domain of unknown function (DUF4288)
MWFAAHVIEVVRLRDGPQSSYPFYENIVLIEADSSREAHEKAEALARFEDSLDRDVTWNDKPARHEYAGIRKIVSCQAPITYLGEGDPLMTGTEVSYSSMEVESEEDLQKLIEGEPVTVYYEE